MAESLNSWKANYVQRLANAAKMLSDADKIMSDLSLEYAAKKYASGASDQISDADIAGTGYTAAQVAAFISTFYLRYNQLMSGQSVTGTIAGRDIVIVMRSN